MRIKSNKNLAFFAVLANLIYIFWRICFTIPQDASLLAKIFSYGLLFAELLGIFELFVYLYGATKAKIPKLPVVLDESFPDVDIFIATYNEPVNLLRKTIIGCKNMKYPRGKSVNIFLCDDGNRKNMESIAKELGVKYLSRQDNRGAKAGNLNNALKHSTSKLIATFDADMIPMQNFLMETVPYFLEEGKKIGFVQTPQSFYNADLFQTNLYSEDRIPNEQDYFYRNVQISKNPTNTVIYGGSNTVISREALVEVGGFFEKSITEDFATGILIQSKGYKCIATDKPLASGLSPHDFKSLIKQRERWARGCIQTIKSLNVFFLKGVTLGQKISYASAISYWYAPIKRFFYIMSPIAFTVFGIRVINASLLEILMFFIPTYVLTNISIKGFCQNIRNARWTNIYETITFPSLSIAVLLETFGISQSKFSVTSKSKNADIDKKYHHKKAIPFYLYVFLSITGVANIFIYMPQYQTLNFIVLLFWLVTNLLYLILALFFVLEIGKSNEEISYKADIEFTVGTQKMRTTEISEDYIKFTGDKIYVNSMYKVKFNAKENEKCEFKIKITKKNKVSDGFEYTGEIQDIDIKNRDIWSIILHDRQPTMPQTIEGSKNIFDDLKTNIYPRILEK